uniref:Uncharacterized protein n=1 Tax=Nelumbo nucifera TaxID=4432 RepID=A0A822XSM7_NELNU|nr:TPA_asm: hypothetical protein HUJ06_023634 [Nelumbo nucifera]
MGSHTSLNQSSLLMHMMTSRADGTACQLRVHSPKEQINVYCVLFILLEFSQLNI